MRSTASSPGYFARLQTPYIDTSGLCLELYFQSQSTSVRSKSVISVVTIDEEQEETVWASTEGFQRTVWDRLLARLPDGVHRVVVEGQRSSYGYSSMAVDDIVVRPCETFSKFDCVLPLLFFCCILCYLCQIIVWLGSLTVTCRTCNPEVTQRRRFDSAPGHCRVTTLGKLCTHMCLCHQEV